MITPTRRAWLIRPLVLVLALALGIPQGAPASADPLVPPLLELIPAGWVWSDFTTDFLEPAKMDDPPGDAFMTEYTIPPGTSTPHGVAKEEGLIAATQGGSANVWVSFLGAGAIMKLDPQTGAETLYRIPGLLSVTDLRVTPNGKVWFNSGGNIGVLDPVTNTGTLYALAGINFLDWLFLDQFGNVWSADLGGNKIVVLNPDTGTAFSYVVGPNPAGVGRRRSGDVWACLRGNGQIARIDVKAGTLTTYPTSISNIEGCAVDPMGDPDGLVWTTPGFEGSPSNAIGVLDPKASTFTQYSTPTPNSDPYGVAIGCAHSVAFGEDAASKVGYLVPSQAVPTTVTPSPGTTVPAVVAPVPAVPTPFVPVTTPSTAVMNSGSVTSPTVNGFREYPTLTPSGEGPHLVVIGPNEKIFFAELEATGFGKVGLLELPPGARCHKQ